MQNAYRLWKGRESKMMTGLKKIWISALKCLINGFYRAAVLRILGGFALKSILLVSTRTSCEAWVRNLIDCSNMVKIFKNNSRILAEFMSEKSV